MFQTTSTVSCHCDWVIATSALTSSKFNSLVRSPPLAVAIRFSIWTNVHAP